MSLEQLETVVAVAEEGGVSRAARRLCLTQPPVTRRLRALEDELGAVLFERTARGMVLTRVGARFLEHARGVLRAVEHAKAVATESLPSPGDDESGAAG
ncbi:MAG: LysR family transcriptional regulator [Myxococcales bacterium]|nr:LysR family transcriptional regulator [Myxococcales bacterium]